MVRRAGMRAILFTIALCVVFLQAGVSARADDAAACEGLAEFRIELLQVGTEWVEATSRAGVDYTADPTTFDSADWRAFAELARQKQHDLAQLVPPPWLDDWLAVQADAAGMQAKAGDAAAHDGIDAVQQFSDEFVDLVERDDEASQTAIGRCPAFATTNAAWDWLNQDFRPVAAPPAASPAGAAVESMAPRISRPARSDWVD